MAVIKHWSIGQLGKGSIVLDGVLYEQGYDVNGKPGIEAYVPTDPVDWKTDNRPLQNLVENDEKLNTHIQINSTQVGNGIFQEFGDKFLVSIIPNKLTRTEINEIFIFKEERHKIINFELPKGYRYFWSEIEDELNEDKQTVIGTENTPYTAKWYWKQWVDGVIIENDFTEVDNSSVITNDDDKKLVKEILQNRARLEGLTPLHVASGVAFINGSYSTVEYSKAVYDENSYSLVSGVKYYNTDSGADTLLKLLEDELKKVYSDANPAIWKVELTIDDIDTTGLDPHNEYNIIVTIGNNTTTYHGQFFPLIAAEIIWDQGGKLDTLYDRIIEIGEVLIPFPAQIYNVENENTPFREYDPRYKLKTSGFGYPQSADPDVVIRHSGINLKCDNKGLLPVEEVEIFRDFENKEVFLDTSGASQDTIRLSIPIHNQGTQIELSYEVTEHIEKGEGRWDDFYSTWINGYEPDPTAVKNITAITELNNDIYFAYHHKLYKLIQNPNLPHPHEGPSLDSISTSIDEGEFTFGAVDDVNSNTVSGNTSNSWDAQETITALHTYDGWIYIGTSNGYIYRFQPDILHNNIEQVQVLGAPDDLEKINTFYTWEATGLLAVGTNNGAYLIRHESGQPIKEEIEGADAIIPSLDNSVVTAFTEVSKYGTGYTQILIIGTKYNGIYYYGDREFNSGQRLHHDDNYTNFVINGSGFVQNRRDQNGAPEDFSDNYVIIKKFLKHKNKQDSNIYMIVGIEENSTAWEDDFGTHTPGDDELWRLIDGNNEGDHENFAYQRINLYKTNIWKIGNLLQNASFEDGVITPSNWFLTGAAAEDSFTKSENGYFELYNGKLSNNSGNNLSVWQVYFPASSLTQGEDYTFSIYLSNKSSGAINASINIEALDISGSTVIESNSTNITLSDNAWNRYSVALNISNPNSAQIKVSINLAEIGQIEFDGAKLEQASSPSSFITAGLDETDFTINKEACELLDGISYNNHIILGGLRDVRGEDGNQMNVPGYTYPPGAPADEEYPNRPDGGINSGIDTIDGSITNTIDSQYVDYLSNNGGLYYIDQLMLQNTTFGIDIFCLYQDSTGTLWGGSKARLFKIHSETEDDTSEYISLVNDLDVPTIFRTIVTVPASDNPLEMVDPTEPLWHQFVDNTLINNRDKYGLIKGSVIVRNAPNSRVTYVEGRDYEVDYDPNSNNYGKIKRKPNPLFEGGGQGRIEPDQRIYIQYSYYHILDEVNDSSEGFKELDYKSKEVTINLPSNIDPANYELYCDYVYTRKFKGVDESNPNFNTPQTGIKENLKPFDYVTSASDAHIWPEKYHLIAYCRDQRRHPVYANYKFSIPRVDIIQLNYTWNENGFVTSITPGVPHESAPLEPNPSIFDEYYFVNQINSSGGSITRQHVWYGFKNTNDAIKMYTLNVTHQDYRINDIYDKRYYITKLQLKDYFIGIKSDTEAYFPFSRSFISSNGDIAPEPKNPNDPTSAVTNSSVEVIDDKNILQFNTFPGEFDEKGFYDKEDEFNVYWTYTPDYFGLATFDKYGVGAWHAAGDPPYNPGIPKGLYVVAAKSTGIAYDNQNAVQINRNLVLSQSFQNPDGSYTLPKDVYEFKAYYFLENAYNATSGSKLEIRIYYEENSTEYYYSTIKTYSDLVQDKLDYIAVKTEAAIVPTRIEIITSGWDESDEYQSQETDPNMLPAYVGGTIFQNGSYRPKLNLYISAPTVRRTGIETTKFYHSAARFGERIKYPVKLSGLEGTIYFKFKPTFRYNFNESDNSSVVIFDSRSEPDQENYFQIIYDRKNYNTQSALDKVSFSNLGTDGNPYPQWPQENGQYWNSFKVVFYARELNIEKSAIDYKYRSYSLDINDPDNKIRKHFENNEDFQKFHTFIITWKRMDEMYPDPLIYSDGYNNWQFMMTFYFDDLPAINKVIIVDPNYLENLSEHIQIGGGWLKQSYDIVTQQITWKESFVEGFFSEFRVENQRINYDKAQLWINKQLPFLDADNIPIIKDIYTWGDEVRLLSGTTGQLSSLRTNDVTVEGDLYVLGTEIISNISKMIIEDNIVEVNRIQEIDENGNWIGIPKLASPVRSGLKSYRNPDAEQYDSALIWNEDADEWQLIELSKFEIVYDDNVLNGASWQQIIGTGSSTGPNNALYTIVEKVDNIPTPLYQNSKGTFTFKTQIKSQSGNNYSVRFRFVAQLHDLSEIENVSPEINITSSFVEHLYRVIYDTPEIEKVYIYIEIATPGFAASDIVHQNDFFAKTTINTDTYEIPHETQDLRLRKATFSTPIANPGKEAYITVENNKNSIRIVVPDGIYINNGSLASSMVLRSENDIDGDIELLIYDQTNNLSRLHLNSIRTDYIENINNNDIITTFSGKVNGTQKYNLQVSKSGHIEPGPDESNIYFSLNNDQYQLFKIDENANIQFRKALLRNADDPAAQDPIAANIIESKLLDLGDSRGVQPCIRITQYQVGTGTPENAPVVASEISLQNENDSNGIRYLQTYKITFNGRIAGAPGQSVAVINHNLNIPLEQMIITFGISSPLRHVYWDPELTNPNTLVVKLDDENTMVTTNDPDPNNWVDPNDGKIIVFCTIAQQTPITSNIVVN